LLQVGIITPYKGQRAFITRLFEQALGPAAARAVRIETVDSFQGKQMDVIMLSCVRAGGGGSGGWGAVKGGGLRAAKLPGVGFLADTRRMNVAITRARLALWVLGHHATLQSDPTWRALFADAAARGCLVADASAERLFPAGCPAGGVRNAGGAAAAVGAGGGQLGLGGQPLLQGGQLALAAGLTGAAAAAAGGGAGPSGEATPPPAAAEEAAVGQMDWVAAERLRQEKAFKEKQAKFEQLQKQKQEAAAAKAAGAAAAGPPAAGRASEEDQQAPPAGGAQEEVMALQQQPPQMLAEVRAIMVADTAGRLAPVQVDQMQVGPNLVAFTRVLDPLVRWVVEESMALHQRMQQQQQQGPAAG
jgi:senataxin